MSIKTRAGQVWTDSVAYVALLTGAGLSIAGNVADVQRVRGGAMDNLDVTMAVVFPTLVVLMVEVFVSSRWRGLAWPMQVLRWVGCGAVTAVAMRVSWVHLNELMLSRGQKEDVATFGPLAIDFLAIMATALILAGRGQVAMPALTADEILAKRMDREARKRAAIDPIVYSADNPFTPPVSVADEASDADVIHVESEASMWARLEAELDTFTTPAHPLDINPVSPGPTGKAARVKPESVPDEAKGLILTWAMADPAERPMPGQVDTMIGSAFAVSRRTARGWRDALIKAAV